MVPQSELDSHILATARRLVEAEGEARFTMDQLAAASGTSRATLYRRFGHRQALLQRLARQHNLRIDELRLPADLRLHILQATRTTLSQAGSLNFTLEQVAETAGIGVATIYRHFGNRENLLRSLAETIHPRRDVYELLAHPNGNLEDDLTGFALAALDFLHTNSAIIRIYLSGNRRVQELFSNLGRDQERTLASLAHYLAEQVPASRQKGPVIFEASDLAAAFLGLLVGFAYIKPVLRGTLSSTEQSARLVVRLFLYGVGLKDA